MMRNLRRDDLGRRFRDWRSRVEEATVQPKRAIDLYCGNAWSIIRELVKDSNLGDSLRIWVASAGHGLLSLDDKLTAYDATFVSGQVDSVIPPELSRHSVTEWWDLLAENRRKQGADVARIANIAERYPQDPLLVVVSNNYLKAIAHDIELAQGMMADADKLVIIAVGAPKTGKLADNYLPCDARLENIFGRSRSALNSRILKLILTDFRTGDLRSSHLKGYFEELLAILPKADYPQRQSSDDGTVCEFIRKNLKINQRGSYSNFLRLYRATGRACEQKRFRRLFRKVFAAFKKGD